MTLYMRLKANSPPGLNPTTPCVDYAQLLKTLCIESTLAFSLPTSIEFSERQARSNIADSRDSQGHGLSFLKNQLFHVEPELNLPSARGGWAALTTRR